MTTSTHPAAASVLTRRTDFEKAIIVTRKTQLEELLLRFHTPANARFYLEHAGGSFDPIAATHERYQAALRAVRRAVPGALKQHVIDRGYLPQFLFSDADLVITLGPDGLVVNTAKYLHGQPIVPVNPDPETIDGILLPISLRQVAATVKATLQGKARMKRLTMAQARLNDGQEILGVNDLFIGAQTHVSARYEIAQGSTSERHSSSGVIVSTGVGSTGWLQSIYAGALGVVKALGGQVAVPPGGGRLPWDTDHLVYAVREPFPSKTTATSMIFGVITRDRPLRLASHMASDGVIFSDGIEADYLPFNQGALAEIGLADRQTVLVTGGDRGHES